MRPWSEREKRAGTTPVVSALSDKKEVRVEPRRERGPRTTAAAAATTFDRHHHHHHYQQHHHHPRHHPRRRHQVSVIRDMNGRGARSVFNFDNVFTDWTTQSEVFETTLQPMISDVMRGFEATVFAYGQTGDD